MFGSAGKDGTGAFFPLSSQNTWAESVCQDPKSRWKYATPFAFHYTFTNQPSSVPGSSGDLYCGYAVENTSWRISLACFSMLVILACFRDNWFIFNYGEHLLFFISICFYSAFIIDIANFTNGSTECTHAFFIDKATLEAQHLRFDCNMGTYFITVAIDLFCALLFLLIWRAWGACSDVFYRTSYPNTNTSQRASSAGGGGNINSAGGTGGPSLMSLTSPTGSSSSSSSSRNGSRKTGGAFSSPTDNIPAPLSSSDIDAPSWATFGQDEDTHSTSFGDTNTSSFLEITASPPPPPPKSSRW